MDRDRALMRKLFDMALQGKVPAIQLVLARLARALEGPRCGWETSLFNALARRVRTLGSRFHHRS